MITNIIELMRALDYVRGSSFLTPDQKAKVVKELKLSLPAKSLCHSAQRTHEIAEGLFDSFLSVVPQAKEENPAQGQRLPGLREGEDGIPGDDRKKVGRPPKVARS